MYKYISTFVLVTMLSFLGCGGGSSSDDNNVNNNNSGNVVIDSQQKAINAFAVIGSFMDVTEDLGEDVNVMDEDNEVAIYFSSYKSRGPINITRDCLVSGTMSMVGETGEGSAPINITTTFVNCKNQADNIQDGSAQISGTEDNAQIVFTNYSVTDLNGTRSMNLTVHVQGTDANRTMIMDGTITAPEGTVNLTDFEVNINEVVNSMTMNGTLSMARNPATCADGTYVIETLQTLISDPVTEDIISGQIKINGVLFTFDANGQATATINGQVITIDATEDMEINCS